MPQLTHIAPMNNHNMQLKEYSMLAGYFLLLQSGVQAEITHHDFVPDIILNASDDAYILDIDFDGHTDFVFENLYNHVLSHYTYSGEFQIESIRQRLVVRAFEYAGVAGSRFLTYSSSGSYYFPFALFPTQAIDASLQFNSAWYQRLAYGTTWGDATGPIFYGGNWFPEKAESFLGVRIQQSDACWMYGWIRCSVLDEGSTLVLHDFAYESDCNTSIAAGDIIGIEIETTPIQQLNIYSFGNTLFIHGADKLSNAILAVFDLSGKKLISKPIHETSYSESFDLISGSYIITISSDEGCTTQPVFLRND